MVPGAGAGISVGVAEIDPVLGVAAPSSRRRCSRGSRRGRCGGRGRRRSRWRGLRRSLSCRSRRRGLRRSLSCRSRRRGRRGSRRGRGRSPCATRIDLARRRGTHVVPGAAVELTGCSRAGRGGAVGEGFGEGGAGAGEDEALGRGLGQVAGVVAFPQLHPLLGGAAGALERVDVAEIDRGTVCPIGPDRQRPRPHSGAIGAPGNEMNDIGMEGITRRSRQIMRLAAVVILERELRRRGTRQPIQRQRRHTTPTVPPNITRNIVEIDQPTQSPCACGSKPDGQFRSITNHHSSRPARPSASLTRGSSSR